MNNLPRQFINNSRLHAYLLVCPDSSLASRTALEISASLMCRNTDKNTAESCGKCSDCIKLMSGTHPDLHIIGDAGNKVGVDDIRAVSDEAYLASNEADCKVFLLKNADLYNVQAQNALLKILEEPPEGVKFVLTASGTSSILPTVRSRLFTLHLSGLGKNAYYQTLKKARPGADDGLLVRMAAFAAKYEGTELSEMDEKVYEKAFSLAAEYFSGNKSDVLLEFPRSKDSRKNMLIYLQVFYLALGEIMYAKLYKIPEDAAFTESELHDGIMKTSSKRASVILDGLEKAIIKISSPMNYSVNLIAAELGGVL